ncbi:MAG: hypothetical protein ACYTFY_03030 [Planctomycetota bacterium]|jgi:hypothetical protein
MKQCYKCGKEWLEKHTPGYRDECEKCFSPLCCCRNCKFYRDDSAEWCGETEARAEKPRDPEVANKCSYFLMADRDGTEISSSRDAKEKLAALFGDTPKAENNEKADWMKAEKEEVPDFEEIFKPPDK